MRCLWLTLADPDPPHNGQYVYSGGLIEAFAQAGAQVTVLGLSRPESMRCDGERSGGVLWRLSEHQPLSHWSSLLSSLPNIANRCRALEMRETLDELLWRGAWDVVVFDGLSAGWALRSVLKRHPRSRKRPRLVYISHNHEESLRARLAANQPHFLKRQALRLDAAKVALLERALVEAVDLVTAITPEDGEAYRRNWPMRRIEVLTPGYRGRRIAAREITGALPRRAVVVGSFDWVAKRMNLEEFVRAADPIFAARGIELQVVGSGDASFFERLRRQVAATRFTGTVDNVAEFLDSARVAIVPERNGGGFKLKVLEYVFNRMPILALQGSIAGVPLRQEESVLLYSSQETLAAGVARTIDDIARLNRMQDAAFSACRGAFDWASRGRQLVSAVGSL
jgi:glycosyltransferase involved in cell wall biosynthesis